MKTEREREEIIKTINTLLNQAYDSTLDEILIYLKRIEEIEDEEDLKAYDKAKKDIEINETVPWEQVKKDMKKNVA